VLPVEGYGKHSEESIRAHRRYGLDPRWGDGELKQSLIARSLDAYMRLVQEQLVQRSDRKIKLTVLEMLRFFGECPDPQGHVLYADR
jgi:hypothetical protein